MKKITIIALACFALSSCTVTRKDGAGKEKLTWNAKHFQKIHPNGFYAGGKYIKPLKIDSNDNRK